eukprot:GHVP01061360.1.p1 GENE.GHVP01061360.1~~GHVP01061360.1.p1  ORF type:complete len:1125 (+),score=205.80 GHVP01061360.1:27-3401(+)
MLNLDLLANCGPDNIRNVCIIAHVDHGKTTLSDQLIATNGMISKNLAGNVRFLDSREDEQVRQITMKTSFITLKHKVEKQGDDKQEAIGEEDIFINLVDSPGHVDFAAEVSTATRVADGGIVVIDAVEGMGPQTRKVLSQAWAERVTVVVMINKLDKLFTQLKLSAADIYDRCCRIIEDVNALCSQLLAGDMMKENDSQQELESPTKAEGIDEKLNYLIEYDEDMESRSLFSPAKGNVVFGSALNGWSFDTNIFARLFAQRLGLHSSAVPKLATAMWGDFYYHPKTKRISKKRPKANYPNVATQFIFSQLLTIFDASTATDKTALEKIICSLDLSEESQKSIFSARGSEISDNFVNQILREWLPLGKCLLDLVSKFLPSPRSAATLRLPAICPLFGSLNKEGILAQSMLNCSVDGPAVVFVTKFISADLQKKRITSDRLRGLETADRFVGISRVFSGMIRVNDSLFVCLSDAQEEHRLRRRHSDVQRTKIVVTGIYYLQGRDLLEVASVSAGQMIVLSLRMQENSLTPVATDNEVDKNDLSPTESVDEDVEAQKNIRESMAFILSLRDPHSSNEDQQYRESAGILQKNSDRIISVDRFITLSTVPECPVFAPPYSNDNLSLIRVSVQPKTVRDLHALVRGLALLLKADPSVEVDVFKGDYRLGSTGDVHLEKSLNDLRELYAQVPFTVSEPIYALRETYCDSGILETNNCIKKIAFPPWMPVQERAPKEKQRRITTQDGCMEFVVEPCTLPQEVVSFLDASQQSLKLSCKLKGQNTNITSLKEAETQFIEKMSEAFSSDENKKYFLKDAHLLALTVSGGARTALMWKPFNRPNPIEENKLASIYAAIDEWGLAESYDSDSFGKFQKRHAHLKCDAIKNIHSIVAGFEMASRSGPLSEEPVRGVAYVLSSIDVRKCGDQKDLTNSRSKEPKDTDSALELGSASGSVTQKTVPFGPVSGQIISAVKELCRKSIVEIGRCRIYEAVIRLELQCWQDVVGKVYNVLARRRSTIVSETLMEGTAMFSVVCFIPAQESTGLAADLRSSASGKVSVHLQFSHWELLEEDPFPEANMKLEEYEDVGELGIMAKLQQNVARNLLIETRKRKGLPTGIKIVASAEKQRTLSQKK